MPTTGWPLQSTLSREIVVLVLTSAQNWQQVIFGEKDKLTEEVKYVVFIRLFTWEHVLQRNRLCCHVDSFQCNLPLGCSAIDALLVSTSRSLVHSQRHKFSFKQIIHLVYVSPYLHLWLSFPVGFWWSSKFTNFPAVNWV